MPETQDTIVFWKPEISQRGTFNIIVTCFSTLGICLWSALHLSIPRKKRTFAQNLGIKLLWMAMGLFLPEVLILVAVEQRSQAANLRDKVNAHFKLLRAQRPWYQRWFRSASVTEEKDEEKTLVKHSSYSLDSSSICSGCDHLKDTESAEKPEMAVSLTPPFHRNKLRRNQWTLVHGFYAEMGGYAYYDGQGELRILDSEFIEYALKNNPELVPNLTEDNILDKSKADGLAKALLFTQVGWFCVSCVNRLIQRSPLTLLEVTTLAHALCSMVVYILWWNKPLNVQEPLVISNSSLFDAQKWPPRDEGWFTIESTNSGPGNEFFTIFIVISLVYGAPHLLAWNSTFATPTEQLLWRIASCVVVSILICCLAFAAIYDIFIIDHVSASTNSKVFPIFIFVSSLIYFSASLYLIGESLRQLFHLPPAAFQMPAWSNYFPHFA